MIHLCLCSNQSTCTWKVCIFILRLSARNFWGLVCNAAYPTVSLHIPYGGFGICPLLGFFSFTRCVVQHLGLSTKYWGFHSILEGHFNCSMFSTFLEGVPNSPVNLQSFPRKLDSWSTNLLGGIWYCFRVDVFLNALVCRCSFGILVPWFIPVRKGSVVLWGTALRLKVLSCKVFSLYSFFL